MFQFDEEKVLNAIHILRGNNNTKTNCTHLSKDMINYFKTGIMPITKSSTKKSTITDFDVIISIDWIKKEPDRCFAPPGTLREPETKYLGITQSTVCRDNCAIPGIPCNTEPLQLSNGTYDLDLSVCDTDRFTQYCEPIDKINECLKTKAMENEYGISFGFINIGRCGEYVEYAGHMLVYFATVMNVWYVDCQFYNGIKKINNGCIFSDLTKSFEFVGKKKIHPNVFGENIFYIPVGPKISKPNIVFVKQEDYISDVAPEILSQILSYIEKNQTYPLLFVSKKFNEYIRSKKIIYDKLLFLNYSIGTGSLSLPKWAEENGCKCLCKTQNSKLCEHNRKKSHCKDCKGKYICEHNRYKFYCRDCKGSGICEHDRRRTSCTVCKGISVCEHGRQKKICKDCGGKSLCEHSIAKSQCKICKGGSVCEHDRIRSACKDCKGGSICEHNRRKNTCKDCKGSSVCEHNRIRSICKDCKGGSICIHNRQKRICKDCGGSSLCIHKRQKRICKDCKGAAICEHNRIKYQCKECKGSAICDHDRRKSDCKDCKPNLKRKKLDDEKISKPSKKMKK